MKGKVCLITGATSGIGREAALGLARLGAHVVLVARDQARGEAVVADIKAQTGNMNIDLLLGDLSAMQSVRAVAAAFRDRYDRLDVLVNNAGGAFGRRMLTEDGFEYTFALNHLSYFLLTNLLLDRLKASGPARIVNVSSAGHVGGRIDFDDLMAGRKYRTFKAYADSKLANVLFTYELARRLAGTGITANCLHPGTVYTGIWEKTRHRAIFLITLFRKFMLTPAQGADTIMYLATSPDVDGVTGKYFEKRRAIRSSRRSYDEAVARQLWRASCRLTGLPE